MRLTYVVPAVIFASQAAGAFLVPRQLEGLENTIPEQCQSTCQPLLAVSSCTDNTDPNAAAACACAPILSGVLDECMDCMIKIVEETAPDMVDSLKTQLDSFVGPAKEACASVGTPSDASSSPSATPRPSASRSVDDDDSVTTPTSRPAQSTIRGGSSSSQSAESSTNSDSPLDQGSASAVKRSLGGVAAAAAGALFFL